MRHTKFALAVLTAALLTACGGGTSPAGGDQTTKLTFTNMVSFGDSLSDVGTYGSADLIVDRSRLASELAQ